LERFWSARAYGRTYDRNAASTPSTDWEPSRIGQGGIRDNKEDNMHRIVIAALALVAAVATVADARYRVLPGRGLAVTRFSTRAQARLHRAVRAFVGQPEMERSER
jgi:hypothetical protein